MKSNIIVNLLKTLVLSCSFLLTLNAYADIAVIVSASSAIGTSSASDLKQIFLGKSKSLSGTSVKLINLKSDNATHQAFSEKLLGKNSGKLVKHWAKLVFSGKASAPTQVSSEADMINAVKADGSAVGYVDASKVDASVKVIHTVK